MSIGGGAAGLWYRVLAVSTACGGSADSDYASVLPAALNAARHRRPFIAGWLSRGAGSPLELITNAGPLPVAGAHGGSEGDDASPDEAVAAPRPVEMLFPWGARGVAVDGNMLADLDQFVWAPCPAGRSRWLVTRPRGRDRHASRLRQRCSSRRCRR